MSRYGSVHEELSDPNSALAQVAGQLAGSRSQVYRTARDRLTPS